MLPGIEPDKKLVWTYFEAMIPDRLPKSLLVIGSGAIGIEFASFYRTFGAEVTVVEVLPQILPAEDAEIAAFARKQFEKQEIKIFTSAKVTKLDKKADGVTATVEDGKGGTQKLDIERVISAVGVAGNIENLGLEKVGVKTERGAIIVDPSIAPACPAFMPSAMSPGLRSLRTRPSTRESFASRRSRGCTRIRWTSGSSPAAPIARRRSPRWVSPSRPRKR